MVRAIIIAGLLLLPAAAPSLATDGDHDASANRLVVEAALLVEKAQKEYRPARRLELLTRAWDNLNNVIERHPFSEVAVVLATGQNIGTLSLDAVEDLKTRAEGETCLDAPGSDCLFDLSVVTALAITDGGDRDLALGTIVDSLVEAGYVARAVETARIIANLDDRTWNIVSIARALVEAGDTAGVPDVLAQVLEVAIAAGDDLAGPGRVWLAVAEARIDLGDIAGAQEAAAPIADDFWHVKALSLIARAQAATGDRDGAGETMSGALEITRSTVEEDDRLRNLENISEVLTEIGDTARAFEVARAISEPRSRGGSFFGIASAQVAAGDLAAARDTFSALLEASEAIDDETVTAGTLDFIARKLAQAGAMDEALETAGAIAQGLKRVRTLGTLATAQFKAGDRAGAGKALAAAQEAARAITDPEQRADALGAIAEAEMETMNPDAAGVTLSAARQAAMAVTADEDRVYALGSVADILAMTGDAAAAVETVHAIADEYQRAMALWSVADKLREAGNRDAANDTLAELMKSVQAFTGGPYPFSVMGMVVFGYLDNGDIASALEAARLIPDKEDRVGTLRYIAEKRLEAGDLAGARETLDDARTAVYGIDDDYSRARPLGLIAEVHARMGNWVAASRTARDIDDQEQRQETLRAIARARAEAGNSEGATETLLEALRTAGAISEKYDRAQAFASLAAGLALQGR